MPAIHRPSVNAIADIEGIPTLLGVDEFTGIIGGAESS